MAIDQIIGQVRQWQQQHLTIVLVTGIFDLLHIEHIRFLQQAKAAGDKLVVGLETDDRVKQIKGSHRPVNPQLIRLEQLQAIKFVDLAFILPKHFSRQSDWEQLIQDLQPNIYAVSSHTSHLDNKKAIVEKYGCQFRIVHQFNPEYSTSNIYQHLTNEI